MSAKTNTSNRTLTAVVIVLTCAFITGPCRACFSIVVGKDASADGCVLIAHNEDDGAPQIVHHRKVPRKQHAPGSTVHLRNGGTLDQVEQTWAFIWSEMPGMLYSDSYLNEWGVTVTSDNCPSRENRPQITDGGISYMLRRLIAERAKTAREGVLLAGRLVERFGYVDSGRTYVICDPGEGWLFCVVNGKHWIAQRVPDGEVAMVANTYTIRRVDLSDKRNLLACKDIVEYARSRGWYDEETDGAFDFAAVYANPQAAYSPSNLARLSSGLRCVTPDAIRSGRPLPFSAPARQKLSVTDIMRILRYDEKDPWGQVDPSEASWPLCNVTTQTSFVAQLRKQSRPEIDLVYWVCLATPRTSFFVPFYFGISDFPTGWSSDLVRPGKEAYDRKVGAAFSADPAEAFWTFSNFRDKVNARGEDAVAATKAQAQRIERDAMVMQRQVEAAAVNLYETNPTAACGMLEDYSRGIYQACASAMDRIMRSK